METAFGVIGLAATLLQTSIACYGIFSDAKDCGADQNSFYWQLDTERHRLMRWETIWGINRDTTERKLDPNDYRYRYAVGTLARIIALFAGVENLGTRYGIQGKNTREMTTHLVSPIHGEIPVKIVRRRDRLAAMFSPSRSRSKTREVKSITESPEAGLIPTLDASGVKLLENPSILQNKDLIPGLDEEIHKLNETAIEMQNILPTYRKLQWAIVDKARSTKLIEQLRRYNDGLFEVLPEPSQAVSVKAVLSPTFSKFEVPFRLPVLRNKIFRGREILLEKIHEIVKPGSGKERRVAVLHGLGGIGKSQLSIEYAYRYQSLYSSVFWIDATSQATLSRSALLMARQLATHYETRWGDSDPDFERIGIMIGLPGFVGPAGLLVKAEADGLKLVVSAMEKWLASTGNNNWLIIFENNDDIESVKLKDLVPTVEFGSIIITTRRPEISYLGVGVEVGQIDRDAGISILLASAGKDPVGAGQTDLAEAEMIAEKLSYLPLALNQAGGYIASMQMPLSQYLKLYTKNFKCVASTGHPSLETYRNDTLFTTWQISFDALPLPASELLLLCAFLGDQEIAEELIQRGCGCVTWLGEEDESIHDALRPLLSFSFAKRNMEPDRIIFHPLVLEWARASLDNTGRKKKAEEALFVIGKALEYDQSNKTSADWAFEARAMPHVDMCLRNLREYLSFEVTNDVLSDYMMNAIENVGGLCISHYRLKDAEETIGQVLFNRRKVTTEGRETETLRSVQTMALVFRNQGRYGEALELFREAVAGREKALGKEHPDTLLSLGWIARIFRDQGKSGEALEIYEQILATSKRFLGEDHPRTLSAIEAIRSVTEKQGRQREGMRLYDQTLASVVKTRGENQPDEPEMSRVMVSVMNDLKRHEEVLLQHERKLASDEEKLGKGHPDTLPTVLIMAETLNFLKRNDEALPLYERALAGQEEGLGKDHPTTLRTAHSIAMLLYELGRYDEALSMCERALAGQEEKLGKTHLKTLNTVNTMAVILYGLKRFDESLPLYRRVWAGREENLGKDHPVTLVPAFNMASALHELGRYDEALEMYEHELAGREKKFGKSHPDTLETVHNTAAVLRHLKRYKEALPLYERVLASQEKELGKDDPDTLITAYNMAGVLNRLGQYSKALPLQKRVLAGEEERLGVEHLDTLSTVYEMAMTLYALGRYRQSQDLFQRALDGRQKSLGNDHPDTILTANALLRVSGG